jgi:hypothetical protein
MRGNVTKFTPGEIQKSFEEMGLSDACRNSYPGATIFARQYKRCSVLKEVPITYSGSTVKLTK